VKVIKGDIDNAFHLPPHFLLQYLTLSQFFAHFLRHSKGRLQVVQIFGAKPFFTLATRAGLLTP
jgi:hypothetical protein